MRIKKNNRFLLIVLLAGLVLAVGLAAAAPRFLFNKSQKAENNAKYTEVQQLADALENDPKYKDKESQVYKEARNKFCLLSARPVEQREKAVTNIREFLGKPTVDVDFICSSFEGSGYTTPKTEFYNAALFGFSIDPKTNYIVGVRTEAWEGSKWGTNADGTRWFDPQSLYDYSPRYTQTEAQKVAEKFLTNHQGIFGIDLTKMTLDPERVGKKPAEGNGANYFFGWRNSQGSVDVTITSGGQIIVYTNEIAGQPHK